MEYRIRNHRHGAVYALTSNIGWIRLDLSSDGLWVHMQIAETTATHTLLVLH